MKLHEHDDPNPSSTSDTSRARHLLPPHADGQRRYEVTFTYLATGRQRWQVVDGDLRAARAARGDRLSKIARGLSVAKPSALTVSEVGEAWLTSKTKLRPTTVAWYRHARDHYIGPALGRRKVAAVTVDDVAHLVASMEWTATRHGRSAAR